VSVAVGPGSAGPGAPAAHAQMLDLFDGQTRRRIGAPDILL